MYVFFSAIFAAIGLMIFSLKLPKRLKQAQVPKLISGFIFAYLAAWSFGTGAIAYNDSGNCAHIRTAFGTEYSKCDLGWFFLGWGNATNYPHFITLTNDSGKANRDGSSEKDYLVRMRDNWAARISQTTRFNLPLTEDRFLKLARSYRSAENLSRALLRPAIDASLNVVASEFSMNDYYINHKRNNFRQRFFETMRNGFEGIDGVVKLDPKRGMGILTEENSKNSGKLKGHRFSNYGITVGMVELHSFRPDSDYTAQLKERKSASMKRTLMVEKRMSEEQELRLAKARQQIEISNRSTDALVEKVRITSIANAELEVTILKAKADLKNAEAAILLSEKKLEQARIDAQVSKVRAQAKAFEQKVLSSGKSELDKRLGTFLETNRAWAEAFTRRRLTLAPNVESSEASAAIREAKTLIDTLATGSLEVSKSDTNRHAETNN